MTDGPHTSDTWALGSAASASADEVEASLVGRQLGPYAIESVLGRGAMGVIYLVRHQGLDRRYALKLLRGAEGQGDTTTQRFQRESAILAKLQHPHIIPVHDAGLFVGRPYYVMDYIPGRDLAVVLREGGLPLREGLALLRDVADAVGSAHEGGVIHRDLKPANILVSETGHAYVADFGLARFYESGEQLTRTGGIVGTPAYMSPEQIQGRRDQLGPATDIFSLGVILYELLTGGLPFQSEDIAGLGYAIVHLEPEPPSRRKPELPRDLERVCLRAIEKEPAQRYSSARALAGDLQRFLDFQPVALRPVAVALRARRYLRHHRLAAGALAAVMFFVSLGGVLWSLLAPDPASIQREREAEALRMSDDERLRAAEARLAEARGLAARAAEQLVAGDARAATLAYGRALWLVPEDAAWRAGLIDARLLMVQEAERQHQYALALFFLDDLTRRVGADGRVERRRGAVQTRLERLPERIRETLGALESAAAAAAARGGLSEAQKEGFGFRLTALRDPLTTELMVGALEHRDPAVREVAAQVLMYQDSEQAIGTLTRRMRAEVHPAVLTSLAEALVTIAPADTRVREALLGFYGSQSALARYLQPLVARLELPPDAPEARGEQDWAGRGLILLAREDATAAEAEFSQGLERFPKSAILYLDRGAARLQRNDFAGAREDFGRCIELDPTNVTAYNNRAICHRALGRVEEAYQDLSRAIDKVPQDPQSYLHRGLLLAEIGRGAQALQDFAAALERSPDDPRVLASRGEFLVESGRPREALADFERLVELLPGEANAYYLRGICRGRLGDAGGALEDFDRCIQIEPDRAEYHIKRAVAHRELGDRSAALRDLGRVIELDPDQPLAHIERGNLLLEAGEREAAGREFDRAVKLRPRSWEPYVARAQYREAVGRPADALADLEAADALTGGRDPRMAEALRRLRERLQQGPAGNPEPPAPKAPEF